MAQTEAVARKLESSKNGLSVEVVGFQTKGDANQISKLGRHGGKGGAFVSEIRQAILRGEIDAAMHSLKDMPGNEETHDLVIGVYMRREAVGDVLVSRTGVTFEEFRQRQGQGFKLGTNSVRRAAYIRKLFPHVEIIHYRGAADTRLEKLDGQQLQQVEGGEPVGPADFLVMARSGLDRLALSGRVVYEFSIDEMLPAVGQGIVAVECAEDAWENRALLRGISDKDTECRALAERQVLWVLNGHCNSPIAAHAVLEGNDIVLRAAVISEDGRRIVQAEHRGSRDRPWEIGRAVGLELLFSGGAQIIEESRLLL